MKPRWIQCLLGAWLACAALVAQAQLSIEITGAGTQRLPVAIADFSGERAIALALTSVIRANLERSGLFQIVDAPVVGMTENSIPNHVEWQARGAHALAVGSVNLLPDGRYETRFRLHDTVKQTVIAGRAYMHGSGQIRATAHRIADEIYERLIGERGIFSTRIAYVVHSGGRFELQIADADGNGAQSALASREPIMSPSWSPDGSRLAYVSFESKKPIVWVHDLATGRRHVVANFRGSNSAPAWSPDGRRLAVALTKKGGNPQIYLINADGSGVTRFTNSPGIDTEPRFSPDGAHIYFTSDRGGSPQIYRQPLVGGPAERLTFEGSYNVTPRLSPDGQRMAYVTRIDGRFRVAIMELATRQTQVLTETAKDESPSFSPNGRMILFATEVGGRGVLAAVSADGRIKQRLSVQAADVREPAWGPFLP